MPIPTSGISQDFFNQFTVDDMIQAIITFGEGRYKYDRSYLRGFGRISAKAGKDHTWYEERFNGLKTSLSVAINAVVTTFTVPLATVRNIATSYIIKIDDEQMIIDTVNYTTGVVTVVARGHGSTTASAHLINAVITVLSKAEKEGKVESSFNRSTRVAVTNFYQEMTEDVNITKRSGRKMMKDYTDMIIEERQAMVWKMMRLLDRTLIYGEATTDPISGQETMGGLRYLINSNGGVTQSTLGYANGAFAISNLQALQFEMHQRGSMAKGILCGIQAKQKLTALVKAAGSYATNEDNGDIKQMLGVHYDGIIASEWDGRVLPFIVDNNMESNSFALISQGNQNFVTTQDENGADIFMQRVIEPTSSALYRETIRTEGTAEIWMTDALAFCENI